MEPVTYSVGDWWDLDSGEITHTIGYDAATGVARRFLDTFRWTVTGIDAVETPLGWYECYVVSVEEGYVDYLTGLSSFAFETVYVRPEIGTVYSEVTGAVSDGTDTVYMDLTLEAIAVD